MPKRSRSSSNRKSLKGGVTKWNKRRRKTNWGAKNNAQLTRIIKRIDRSIETKETQYLTASNVSLPHNNVTVLQKLTGGALNIFELSQGAGDPMNAIGNRVGDEISVRGVMIKGFFENALGRPKVYYRMMLVRCAKGDTIDRTTLYKNDANNKMIDQVNTERFSIVSQKIFNVSSSNYGASTTSVSGEPFAQYDIGGNFRAGIGTRIVKMWIPGVKFGRDGIVKYESGSATQVKFYDYRLVVVAYDWYGTPQDVNTVGKINELLYKVYYKDA